jgi:ribonuclease HI
MSDESGEVVNIHTGGTCSGNPGPGGWGTLLRYGRREKKILGGDATTTTSRMELTAPVRALESLTRSCVVRIHTGSAHVHDGVTWRKSDGSLSRVEEPVENADLWRQLDAAMKRHEVTWRWVKDHTTDPDNERALGLAIEGMRRAVTGASPHHAPDDRECVHEMPIAWCALCKPPLPGVRPHGYRTKAGDAYHNDPNCTWLHRGQRQAERQGKNIHDIVHLAWADVRPGELEPCESCCTPDWLKRHGY